MRNILICLLSAVFCVLSVGLLAADGEPVRIPSDSAMVPDAAKLSLLRNTHDSPTPAGPLSSSAYRPPLGSQDVSRCSLQGQQRLLYPMMEGVASGLLHDRNDSVPEPLNHIRSPYFFAAILHSGPAPPFSSRLEA